MGVALVRRVTTPFAKPQGVPPNARLRAENAINTIEPQLVNPSRGDFHPVSGGNVFRAAALAIPDFTWADAPSRPAVPGGTLINRVPNSRDGTSRAWPGHPGAY